MAKFQCVCGTVISTSGEIPNPHEWACLSAVALDALPDSAGPAEFYRLSALMYRCPRSGHLWIFWSGMENDPSLYAPAPLPEP